MAQFYYANPQTYRMKPQRFEPMFRGKEEPIYPPMPPEGPITGKAAKPIPIPTGKSLEHAEAFDPLPPEQPDYEAAAISRLRDLGLNPANVDKISPLWGEGYIATGGEGERVPSYSQRLGVTANIKPGAFAVGGVDPRQREFMVQRGNQIAEAGRRELSNFLKINAPTGGVDRYGTSDPLMEARIRAARAEAAAREDALNPMPQITVDNPEEVERAGGQAAYNAQKLAEAKYAAANTPVAKQALESEALLKARTGAAPYAMSMDAGTDARQAFLQWLFNLQQQGATESDIAKIAALVPGGATPEEVKAALAKAGGR